MTKEAIKDALPILQAYAEGKEIEMQEDGEWVNAGAITANEVCLEPKQYRIKPEKKFRPFRDAEECIAEMSKHQPFGWIKAGTHRWPIQEITENGVVVAVGIGFAFKDLLPRYQFLDGSPMGIEAD